ncbi:hypothetical protein BH20ACI2_BH20ACI2_11080 [soil metagenome]
MSVFHLSSKVLLIRCFDLLYCRIIRIDGLQLFYGRSKVLLLAVLAVGKQKVLKRDLGTRIDRERSPIFLDRTIEMLVRSVICSALSGQAAFSSWMKPIKPLPPAGRSTRLIRKSRGLP